MVKVFLAWGLVFDVWVLGFQGVGATALRASCCDLWYPKP